ncbi:hypothetical protein KIW84_023101 [Lathyrus oleraceus]|uniref:Exonuclease domain-containing protein n=1 Tax=Pisum sativum TaxID=3888 RepID=A0A9D4YGK2_PEA|nr:hypothetical protein KIW84_023101 [Pisum sativum]
MFHLSFQFHRDEPGPHSVGNVPESNRHLGSEFLEHSNEFHSKPAYHHDYSAWTTCHFNPHKLQQCQMNAFESHFHPYPVENQLQCVPVNMLSQGYSREQYQEFQYFVLEACFQTYVKPTCNQLLSDFCKDLTGIQQIQDCRVMLESECRFKKIRKPPYFNCWINLRIPFSEVFGDVKCNLKEAVEIVGLAWQGRPHCGLDDAKSTARLLALLMHRGFKFSITNSILWQTADRSLLWKQTQ